jgi:ABC-type lipoprotein export system ATPase subunit
MSIVMKGLRKSFGKPPTHVLNGIDSEIKNGEMVAITGRSGSGKSTLLYLISTLDRPTSGEVILGGKQVTSMSSAEVHQFRNENMGFIFQFHHLLPELTALENVLMPAVKSGQEKTLRARGISLLREFGLEGKADRPPGRLSGGEQQRVAIARALIMEPAYLFADEPTGNLDSANGLAVLKFFQKINQERGTTLVYVTHDPAFADMASRKIVLIDGHVSEDLCLTRQ